MVGIAIFIVHTNPKLGPMKTTAIELKESIKTYNLLVTYKNVSFIFTTNKKRKRWILNDELICIVENNKSEFVRQQFK